MTTQRRIKAESRRRQSDNRTIGQSDEATIRLSDCPTVRLSSSFPTLRSLLLLCLLLVIGCVSQPTSDPEYVHTYHQVHAAAAAVSDEEPATLPTEPELDGPHPVDFYVQIGLQRSPDVLAARRTVAAQDEVIPQVTALDDPMLSETFWPITDHSPQTASGRMPNALMLSQKFPWFGKLQLRGEVAEQETRMALSRLAATELDVIENIRLAYYELAFTQQAIRITEQDQQFLEDLIQFIDARYRTRQAPLKDLLRAQIELTKVRDRLVTLRQQLRQAQADLARLLHTSPDQKPEALAEIEEPSVPEEIDQLYEAAVRCRPELHEWLYAILRDQRVEELARLDYYPDLTVGTGWDLMTTDDALSAVADGKDNVGFTVGVNLPIWRDKLRAGVREAEHRAVASARRYDALRDETFRLIRRLMVQANALQEQIDLFREEPDGIIPKAEQTLRILYADYRVGQADFQDLIDNYSRLLAYHVQLIRLQANLAQTLASLERTVGCELVALPDTQPSAPALQPLPDEPEPSEEPGDEPAKPSAPENQTPDATES